MKPAPPRPLQPHGVFDAGRTARAPQPPRRAGPDARHRSGRSLSAQRRHSSHPHRPAQVATTSGMTASRGSAVPHGVAPQRQSLPVVPDDAGWGLYPGFRAPLSARRPCARDCDALRHLASLARRSQPDCFCASPRNAAFSIQLFGVRGVGQASRQSIRRPVDPPAWGASPESVEPAVAAAR
jgi:hypothetical protein